MPKELETVKKYYCKLLVMVVMLFFHGQVISTPQPLTSDQLIQRVEQQTGGKVIALSQLDRKKHSAQARLLYPSGEVKQHIVDTRNGKLGTQQAPRQE